MIDLETCKTRVAEIEQFRYVEGVVDFTQALENPNVATPAAFVSIGRERAGQPRYATGPISQLVTVDLSVMILLGQERADWDLVDPVEAAREAVKAKLIGWTPPGAGLPLTYGSFGIRAMTDGLVWAELMFPTVYNLEGPVP